MDQAAIRKKLGIWFDANQRDLPWRRTRDPYAIWISEIMLQQTRVAAVIPYYERFLTRFPDASALAEASEVDVLNMWAGLGYYSRARNLQKAAGQVVAAGSFPSTLEGLLQLAGIGSYTAAAVGSIAFGLPHPSVDGNVRRVVMRLAGDAGIDVDAVAGSLIDPRNPGRSNQALMELGAIVCIPGEPKCAECPLKRYCAAQRLGIQKQLPPPKVKAATLQKARTLVVIRRRDKLLLVPSPRVAGFWDLPEPFEGVKLGAKVGMFRHAITNSQYSFEVREGRVDQKLVMGIASARWFSRKDLEKYPLSTASKKALQCLESIE
ncbi:MAG: A/G-specific adenine glycosylase [Acidobacteriota bacterium]